MSQTIDDVMVGRGAYKQIEALSTKDKVATLRALDDLPRSGHLEKLNVTRSARVSLYSLRCTLSVRAVGALENRKFFVVKVATHSEIDKWVDQNPSAQLEAGSPLSEVMKALMPSQKGQSGETEALPAALAPPPDVDGSILVGSLRAFLAAQLDRALDDAVFRQLPVVGDLVCNSEPFAKALEEAAGGVSALREALARSDEERARDEESVKESLRELDARLDEARAAQGSTALAVQGAEARWGEEEAALRGALALVDERLERLAESAEGATRSWEERAGAAEAEVARLRSALAQTVSRLARSEAERADEAALLSGRLERLEEAQERREALERRTWWERLKDGWASLRARGPALDAPIEPAAVGPSHVP